MPYRGWITCCIVTLGLLSAEVGAAERIVNIRDFTGRGFAPQVIGYRFEGKEPVHVIGPDGHAMPAQVYDAPDGTKHVLFLAELGIGAEGTWKLVDGAVEAHNGAVKVAVEGESLVVSNGLLAVRLPGEQDTKFDAPVAAQTLPAPILGYRGRDGSFSSGGTMLGDLPVHSLRVARRAEGPVRAEVTYELGLANGGWYRALVRVDAGEPIVEVEEAYDLKGAAQDAGWSLTLVRDWVPTSVEWIRAIHNGLYDASVSDWGTFITKIANWGGAGYGVQAPPKEGEPFPDRYVTRLILPDDNWGGDQVQYVGFSGDRTVGFLTLHKGSWRRINALPLWVEGQQVSVQLPIGVRPSSWLTETSSETGVLSNHTHDPSLPATEGRRVWALQLAPCEMPLPKGSRHKDAPFLRAHIHYGTLTLDRYKDFVLQWDDSAARRPAVFVSQEELPKLRAGAASSPAASVLARTYLGSGNTEMAKASAQSALKHLDQFILFLSTTPAMGHHDTSAWIALRTEDALSCRELPDQIRSNLLSRAALMAYLMSDPNIFPKGNGSHPGPANMAVAMNAEAALWVALVQEHPMGKAWRDYWTAWLDAQSHVMTIPGGGWQEYGQAYQMHGFGRVVRALIGLHAAGADLLDWPERSAATWHYTINQLTPPDPRIAGEVRWITGGHHSPPGPAHQFFEGIAQVLPHDAKLAGKLLWSWLNNGADSRNWNEDTILSLLARPWVQPEAPVLDDAVMPGWGVVFRGKTGPKEQWLNLRGGTIWGHAYPDQGNFSFMSRGSIHVPWQPYQYYWHDSDKSISMYNTVRFGDPTNESPYAWPDQTTAEHAFGEHAGYARISVGFPAWYIDPAVGKGYGKPLPLADVPGQNQGAFRHERQVTFLKAREEDGPTYLVIRDTVLGEGKLASWLNLNLLGRDTDITGEPARLVHKGTDGMDLEIHFLQEKVGQQRLVNVDKPNLLPANHIAGPLLKKWMAGKPMVANWARKDGKPADWSENLPDVEHHVVLQVQGEPGSEYHWVLFPRMRDEPSPQIVRLAPGVVRVVHSEGTDWIFQDPTGLKYDDPDVAFAGTAGVVRQGKSDNQVQLILHAGGSVTWKKSQTTLSGAAACEQVVGQPAPVVSPSTLKLNGLAHVADEPFSNAYFKDGVAIRGGRGGVQVLQAGSSPTVRFVAPDASLVEMTVGSVGIRGMGPFDLTVTPDGWSGWTDGAGRTLVLTMPANILRPMFLIHGRPWSMWWADEPAPWKGRDDIQWSAAITVDAGPQEVQVVERVWPMLPPRPPVASIQ